MAELEVCKFYLHKGFCLRAHRLKTPFSEVDLLLENASVYLMVEVKLTSFEDFESYRVSHIQKTRLENSHLFLSQELDKPLELQYVVVSRCGKINAFDAISS